MVKTRSQTRNITIKKEEDCKPILTLGHTSNTRNKITKRRPSKNKNNSPVSQVKVEEEDTDTKSLLQSSSKYSTGIQRQYISQEQINRLIDYIVNHEMSVSKASRKVNISLERGHHYYNLYKKDPDRKIPLVRYRNRHPYKFFTQEHIENLIKYIVDDKMAVRQASAKAKMTCESGRYYYNKYLKDPNHAIPIPCLYHRRMKDQENEFIGYIINDKMSITRASKQAKINKVTGRKYYHEYFDDQNPDIRAPSHITIPKRYTQEQISKVISHIVNDKMTINAASKKANMCPATARNYYRQYLKANNMEIPASKYHNRYTQDQIDEFIGYIVDDKMLIKVASKKVNIPYATGKIFYSKYVKDPNTKPPAKYTQDQINEMIGYIVNDKMTIRAVAKKANMTSSPGKRYYHQYAKDHNLGMLPKKYTQDQKDEFIRYIVDEKMTVKAASKKANIHYASGKRYYRRYLKNQKPDSCT